MAKCTRCGKKGLFLKLYRNAYCADCMSAIHEEESRVGEPAPITSRPKAPVQNTISFQSPSDWKIQLQNITCNMNHSRLVVSDSQLQTAAAMYIENRLRIVKDCISILNSTKNPDTFYKRRDLLLKNMDELCEIERIRPQLFTQNVSSQANTIRAEMRKNEAAMLERAGAIDKKAINDGPAFSYEDWKAQHNMETRLEKEYSHVFKKHEMLMEQIGATYSIANELTTPLSAEMDHVIALCKEDIALAPQIREYWKKRDDIFKNEESSVPKNYPTFSRLAIIYEKRKEYQKALDVCSQAISLGFTSDRTEGGMVGRAARLTRKLNQENARIANPEPVVVVEDNNAPDGIVTTSTEIECFAVIKTLLHDVIDVSRISYKDTKSYFSVIVDGKTSKWLCRLRVEGKTKTVAIPDETGKEIRHTIRSADDIINHKEELLGRIIQIDQ